MGAHGNVPQNAGVGTSTVEGIKAKCDALPDGDKLYKNGKGV